jgi:hypothetical protein
MESWLELGRITETIENKAAGAWRESTDLVWIVRCDGDAGVLCVREPKPVVHPGLCWILPVGFGLRISPRRLALRSGRGDLVSGRGAPVVGGNKLPLTRSSAVLQSKFLRIARADAAHLPPNPRSGPIRNAG